MGTRPSAYRTLCEHVAREGEWLVGLTVSAAIDLSTLRDLLRNLQAFEALFENEGIDTITGPDGQDWNLWDLRYLYECRTLLSPRQQQAIELCFYENVKEREAARIMGISAKSPVSIYANNGLKRLIQLVAEGALPKFRLVEAV